MYISYKISSTRLQGCYDEFGKVGSGPVQMFH